MSQHPVFVKFVQSVSHLDEVVNLDDVILFGELSFLVCRSEVILYLCTYLTKEIAYSIVMNWVH